MPRVAALAVEGTVPLESGVPRPITGCGTPTSGLVGVVPLLVHHVDGGDGPVPTAVAIPGANGPIVFASLRDGNEEVYG